MHRERGLLRIPTKNATCFLGVSEKQVHLGGAVIDRIHANANETVLVLANLVDRQIRKQKCSTSSAPVPLHVSGMPAYLDDQQSQERAPTQMRAKQTLAPFSSPRSRSRNRPARPAEACATCTRRSPERVPNHAWSINQSNTKVHLAVQVAQHDVGLPVRQDVGDT